MHRSTGICLISVSWRWTVKLKRRSGFGFYGLIVIILVGLLIAWSKLQGSVKQEINHKEFESHIEKGDIAAIRLIQNSEVPTGEVRLTLDSGLTLFMYTPDINKITEELDIQFLKYIYLLKVLFSIKLVVVV